MSQNESITSVLDTDSTITTVARFGNSVMSASQRIGEAEQLLSTIGPLVKDKYMVSIQGRDYLQVAGAASLGWALGYTTRVTVCERACSGDGLCHWLSSAEVVDNATGEVVGQGFGHVFDDEKPWGNRPHHARSAMAQTRAQGRALKGVVGWLFGMLGAETSLIEEMPPDAFAGRDAANAQIGERQGQRVSAGLAAASLMDDAQAAKRALQSTQAARGPEIAQEASQLISDATAHARSVFPEVAPSPAETPDNGDALFGRAKPTRSKPAPSILAAGDIIEMQPKFIDPYENKSGNMQWFIKDANDVQYVVWEESVMTILTSAKDNGEIVRVQVKAANQEGLKPTITRVVG